MVSIERLESVGPSSSLPAVAAVAAPGRQEDQHEEAEEDPSGGSGGDGWVELMGKEVQMKVSSTLCCAMEQRQLLLAERLKSCFSGTASVFKEKTKRRDGRYEALAF